MIAPLTVTGSPFHFHGSLDKILNELDDQISQMCADELLTPQILIDIYRQAKIDALYHSNRLEGNSLTYGETIDVVVADKEIRGKPGIDQQEARNLSAALDYVHMLGEESFVAVTQNELRRIHSLLLRGIQSDAGSYRTTNIEISGSKYATPEAFLVPQQMTALSDYIRQVSDPTYAHGDMPIFSAAAAHAWACPDSSVH